MNGKLERNIEYVLDDLYKSQNHWLFYGTPERTLAVLTGVYEKAKNREDFLCSWHDASKIAQPMDFFEPILRLKYGEEYESFKKGSWFKYLMGIDEQLKERLSTGSTELKTGSDHEFNSLSRELYRGLTGLCSRDNGLNYPRVWKLPVFFIEGIEQLFFKLDYWYLDEEGREKLLASDFMEKPSSRGFGDCLRARLHQENQAVFYGTVIDPTGIEYDATLGNYGYLFYSENFAPHRVWEEPSSNV